MGLTGCDEAFESFCERLRHQMAPFAGLVEYGNLRQDISLWEGPDGQRVTNVALVYETPGGSTDQINISFDHHTGLFSFIDDAEHQTASIDIVLAHVQPRISTIPEKRRESLHEEIRRQIDGGVGRAGLFGHINRLTQSDFKGGTITHQEMKDAMQFAVYYSRVASGGSTDAAPGLSGG